MSVLPSCIRRGLAATRTRRGARLGLIFAILLPGAVFPSSAAQAGAQPPDTGQGLLRYPDTNGREVVFSSEGDLWIAPLAGGFARRITADEGEESLARFSPDGGRIAFSGQYGGNTDVFVIRAEGGPPSRLTYHPAPDQVVGWTPDGKVLFRSRRDEPQYDWRLFVVSPDGGDPELLPLAQAALAGFSPDGGKIAFNRFSLEWHHWKQYEGGWAQDIYAGDLGSGVFQQITDYKGMDAFPMWREDRIFFLSDRDGVANIYSMTPDGSDVRRATHHTEADVRWPSLGGGRIVYQVAYDIWTLDPASGEARRVDLRLPSDRARTLPRVIDPLEHLQGYALGQEGRRLVLCARGDLASAPTKGGRVIALASTQGVRERDPIFSPDGASVAYISDATGEEEIYIVPSSGGKPRQVTSGSSCYHYPLVWSPDGKKLAYSDRTLTLFVVDVDRGTTTPIARSDIFEIRSYVFSPDSRWIAWSQTEPNQNRAIYVRALAGGNAERVTDPMCDSWDPAWDPDGNYLFFLSRRTLNPYMGSFEENFLFMNGTKPYLVVLASGKPSPFAPKDSPDEEDSADEGAASGKDAPGKAAEVSAISVDLDGLADRIAEVPVEAGNCAMLRAASGRIFWLAISNDGMGAWPEDEDEERESNAALHSFTIEDGEDHEIALGIDDYSLSPDATRICYRSGSTFTLIDAETEGPLSGKEAEEEAVDLSAWDMTVDPVAEWRQMFYETWRLERDFFWDPNMLGVDWKGMRERYGALLPRVTTRGELNDLLGELIAELRTSHEYVGGGDAPGRESRGVGRLGVDLESLPAGAGLKIARIYGADRWNPERSSPLLLPGMLVKEGDYLLAIDGIPVSSVEETHRLLAGKSEESVVLSVSSKPDGSDRRDLYIKTMKSDDEARYDQWVADKRNYVALKTDGRVGYIHIPDMDTAGIVEFGKQFFPQSDKEGLIVDVRNNAGGYAHSMLLERLYRKLWSFANARYLKPLRTPAQAFYGHMVGLCDQRTGSDGESFAEAFKRMGLGPMIGMRTWGGFVGIRGNRALMDGGGVSQPEWPAWGFDRTWLIEGEGVIPDIVVDNDPSSGFRGLDPQLDRAIAVVLDKMAREPRRIPDPPPYPIKAPASK